MLALLASTLAFTPTFRPALMAVCVLLGNIAAHRFPLLPADRYCGHGSTFLHTRLCQSSSVWCALPAGHLLWGSHLRFSCANGGSANTWHCLSLLVGTLKYSLILQAAAAWCEAALYASEDVSRRRAKRKPQRIVAERTLECRVNGAALAKAWDRGARFVACAERAVRGRRSAHAGVLKSSVRCFRACIHPLLLSP